MSESDPKMVLRTVYLPPDLDEKLRVKAFRAGTTKNDLIRSAVAKLLEDEPSFDDELANRRRAVLKSAAETIVRAQRSKRSAGSDSPKITTTKAQAVAAAKAAAKRKTSSRSKSGVAKAATA